MFGMDKVVGKVILITILIFTLLGGMFLVMMEGTLEMLKKAIDFGRDSAEASFNTTLSWLGISTLKDSLPTFIITNDMVENLKSQLNNEKIDTKTNGMTDVVLRKILLTYAATTSLNDTVCMVEVPLEAIIEDFKKKNPTYKEQNLSIDDVKNLCGSLYKKDNSNNIWRMDDNPGYELYYNSSHFFYFEDSEKKFDEGEVKWYLAIMGSTAIETKNGQAFEYRTPEEFVEVKEKWEDALVNKGGDSKFWQYAIKVSGHETSYEELKKSYTRDSASSTKLKVYNIVCKEDSYYYNFKNNNNKDNIDVEIPNERSTKTGEERYTFGRKGDGCTYEATETEIDLDTQVDLSQNSVQIELMLNFLDLTGSDEFLETFIDYAIEESEASVTAYSLEDEEIQYDMTTYNIKEDFIIEAYDMYDFGVQSGTLPTADTIWENLKRTIESAKQEAMETNKTDYMKQIREFVEQLSNGDKTSVALDFDLNDDNFKAYYDIIFNRRYGGLDLPDGKVTSIEDYKDIDFGGGDNYFVSPLHKYLKCAYDPADDFRLGTISVTEVIRRREVTNHWQLVLASVDTWYKKVNYDIPDPKTLYQIEGNDSATKTDYDNHDESKANNPTEKADEQIEDKYIYDKLIEQVSGETPGLIGNYNEQTNNDILENTISDSDIGVGNESQFNNRNINGLAEIAKIDGGEKGSSTGFLAGSDYVYVKYKKTNIKNYKTSKRKKQIIEDSNVEETSSTNDTEAKIDRFLALLRNATGTIPNPLHDGVFTGVNDNPSIVVRYKDIYGGTAPVGDFLLNNGALMLFNLLESYDNTQNLVNVFKYMAYKYSGTDYGVTDINDLMYIFSLSTISGIYGDTIEEQIWFALKAAGYSDEVVAGIMGNLKAESGLNPGLAEEGSNLSATGMNSERYTAAINNGSYTKEEFMNDKIGYGLMQWTDSTRKEGLYDYCKHAGINNAEAQIQYMIKELKDKYRDDKWVNAKTVNDATEQFCILVERPSIPHMENRKAFAQEYYNTFKGRVRATGTYNGTKTENMLAAAEAIKQHCERNGYSYNAGVPSNYSEGVMVLETKYKGVCCASYIAWLLVKSGVMTEAEFRGMYWRGAANIRDGLIATGKFQNLGSIPENQMKPGDLICWNEHIQMYAGNGYYYNGGSPNGCPVKHYKWSGISRYGSNYTILRIK